MKRSKLIIGTVLLLAACRESTGPSARSVSLAANGGTDQYGTVNNVLAEPLQAIITDPVTKRPLENITVTWKVTQGSGATLNPVTGKTGPDGIASTIARLGPNLGAYSFEASAENMVGTAARFDARAVNTPNVIAISPRSTNVGDTITITGSNFSASADENIVLFSGMRGRVVSATTAQLRVVVPNCLPTRSVTVQALLGAVGSNTNTIDVTGATPAALTVARGDAVVFTDPREMLCQRLSPVTGALYLVIPQNISEVVSTRTHFDLVGLTGLTPVTNFRYVDRAVWEDPASAWEMHLRTRERAFTGELAPSGDAPNAFAQVPAIGDRRTFKVYDKNEKFVNVEAEVKHISQRAIIYQDRDAPAATAGGFSSADFQALGASFDSPIYDTDVSVFGQPSDIDSDGKIIILLTKVVNELTPKGSSGFVAGFFFGCDLQTKEQCSGTNRSEIFYLFQPDPTGKYSDARSASFVLRNATPVLAHEFQHMINFAARRNLDALWLSEGLAHMAEDIVGDGFAARGDAASASLFRSQNYSRAALYLRDSTSTSLISEDAFGTLQARGAAWLMVKYLHGHYGGNTLLRTLTQSTASSVQNVTNATGQRWSKLMSDWAVALWADDAPELVGASVKPQYTFPNINLRQTLNLGSTYALRPTTVGFTDFVVSGSLKASSQRHVLVDAGVAPIRPVNMALTGQRGGAFALNALPQVTIFRAR